MLPKKHFNNATHKYLSNRNHSNINNVPIRILHYFKECMNFVENYKIACLGFVQWFVKEVVRRLRDGREDAHF